MDTTSAKPAVSGKMTKDEYIAVTVAMARQEANTHDIGDEFMITSSMIRLPQTVKARFDVIADELYVAAAQAGIRKIRSAGAEHTFIRVT
jgi:hypothetical protein